MSIRSPEFRTAADVMFTGNLVTLNENDLIYDATLKLQRRKLGGAPVVNASGDLVGFFTESDALKALMEITAHQLPPQPVSTVMRRVLDIVEPEAALLHLADLLANDNTRTLLVVDEGKLLGVIARSDLINGLFQIFDTRSREEAFLYLSAVGTWRKEVPGR